MRIKLEDVLAASGRMVIDGSMSTYLEKLGCDLNDPLWTAKALAESPELVKQVHRGYFEAGADCGITCSYQATVPGLMKKGFSERDAEALIVRSVELFCQARAEWWAEEGEVSGRAFPLCLGSVGPYGAYLADGSEYRGHYGIGDGALREFHFRRMELLWNAGADLLLMETQPSLREALVEAEIAEELGADYWISFSCRDGSSTCEGDPIADCAAALSLGHPHLKMVGVNCTAPRFIAQLVREWRENCDLPVAVYPNSGEVYDPATKTWHDSGDAKTFGEYALEWLELGASAVGGCCRSLPGDIRQIAEARRVYLSRRS